MSDLRHPCKHWAEPISLAAAGCLPPDEQREVRRHVETCPDCRERFQQLTQLCGALAEARLPADGAEAAIVQRVTSAVASDRSRRPLVSTRAERIQPAPRTRSSVTWRWIMRSPVSHVAAAVVFVLAITGVALWFHGSGATFAFADFVAPILKAKTVKYKTSVQMKGPPAVTLTGVEMVLDATRSRRETEMPNKSKMVQITDWGQGKSISLYPAAKRATVLEYSNTENMRNDPALWLHLLQTARDNTNKKVQRESLGEKEIDGRRVVGFRISVDHGHAIDLWGDPQTGLPVRVEMTMGIDGNMKATFSDFVFNADLDESLFSVEPPAGYTVRDEKSDDSPQEKEQEEKDLIQMFREYTKLTGGAFPDSLSLHTALGIVYKKVSIRMMWESTHSWAGKASEEQRHEFEEQMSKIMDEVMDNSMAGKPLDEQARKMQEEVRKIVFPMTIQMLWEDLAPPSWKANDQQRHKFEEQMLKILDKTFEKTVDGKPSEEQMHEFGEEPTKILIRMLWEDLAPPNWKANDQQRHKFQEQVLKIMEEKPNEEQRHKIEEEIRKTLGDQTLNALNAWKAQIRKTAGLREAQMQKIAEAEEARSQELMEAQRRVQRGLMFANQLPPSADAHYVGKGVSLGAADTPVFWYRPKDSEKYRVIYADLSVRDADAPPNVPKAQPAPAPSSPKK